MPNETTEAVDWRALPAGRDLDVAVARALGWTMVNGAYRIGSYRGRATVQVTDNPDKMDWTGVPPAGDRSVDLPRFSADMGAAWLAVEAMADNGWIVDLRRDCSPWYDLGFAQAMMADLNVDARKESGADVRHVRGDADTMPLAICRATLAAIEATA